MRMRRSCSATIRTAVTRSSRSSSAMAPAARDERGTRCRGRRCSSARSCRESVAVDRLWLVPFWVALAVRAGLRECGVPATLQWPNDLLLHGRKLGGILCQSRVTAATARVACGAGINVHHLAGAGTVIEPPPAFCDEAAHVDRAALLDRNPARLRRNARDARRSRRALRGRGKRPPSYRDGAIESQKTTGESLLRQRAQSLEEGGGLRVIRDDGSRETVEMADVRILR